MKTSKIHITNAYRINILSTLILIIAYISSISAQDNSNFEVSENINADIIISDYLKVYTDIESTSSIEAIKRNADFESYQKGKKLDKRATHWAKLELRNTGSEKRDLIIQIGNKRSSDFAEMYFYSQNDSLVKH